MTAREGVDWLTARSPVVGVLGDPVAHSLSPRLHNAAFAALGVDWVSVGFTVRAGALEAALEGLRALEVAGVSVTAPHKSRAALAVDRLSETAEAVGAVNCIVREGTELVGHNTDGEGFVASLGRGAQFDPRGRTCIVAGSGGAARAVVAALGGSGAAEVVVVGRSMARAARASALAGPVGRVGTPADAAGADLVVNATPAGMAGTATEGDWPPFDPRELGPRQLAVDLVYHPRQTPWLALAAASGATTLGGLGMLVHQAGAQVELWTGRAAPIEAMWQSVREP